jgi:hypothetical protein
MTENDDNELKIDKKTWLIWVIIVTILVVWWQVAFLVALMSL